ncbi:MAG: ATP-binding protein [Lachnospiraceae bacterium]|nr:ATP-binding protein [Lachnospiraceae bacterium]
MALTEGQYKDIMDGYERRRNGSEESARRRKMEIHAKLPYSKSLDDRIADISADAAKRYIQGDRDAFAGLKEEIASLVEEKKKLLSDNGFPSDYLEVKYACPDCKDTGYIGPAKCHCLKQRIINELYQQSSIMDVLKKENFNSFRLDIYPNYVQSEMQTVYNNAKDFVDKFANVYRNMLFLGNVGSGKTFLSNCIAKAVLDKGYSVVYFSAFRLFDTLAQHVFNKNGDEDSASEVYQSIFNADLLIIDDLGTENTNSFTRTQLFLIINERDLRRHSTIISSNLSLQRLQDEYTERVSSRLISGYDIFKFNSTDLRLK